MRAAISQQELQQLENATIGGWRPERLLDESPSGQAGALACAHLSASMTPKQIAAFGGHSRASLAAKLIVLESRQGTLDDPSSPLNQGYPLPAHQVIKVAKDESFTRRDKLNALTVPELAKERKRTIEAAVAEFVETAAVSGAACTRAIVEALREAGRREPEAQEVEALRERIRPGLAAALDRGQFAVRLAVEEAVNNHLQHGNGCNPLLRVTVAYGMTRDGRFIVYSRDEGPGFDPQKVADPTTGESLTSAGGRGLFLMHRFMDGVEYSEGGRALTMVFDFAAKVRAALAALAVEEGQAAPAVEGARAAK